MDIKKVALAIVLVGGGEVLGIDALERATEHFYLGEYRAAIRLYTEALELLSEPGERAQVHYNLGVCYERLGEYELALKRYEMVREVLPEAEAAISRVKGLLPPPPRKMEAIQPDLSRETSPPPVSPPEEGRSFEIKEAPGIIEEPPQATRAWLFWFAIPVGAVLIATGFWFSRLKSRRFREVRQLVKVLSTREGLIRFLQYLERGQRSGEITMVDGERKGFITIEAGQVINAFLTDLSKRHPSHLVGKEAFCKMMSWDNVKADFSPKCLVKDRNITISTRELLQIVEVELPERIEN